MPRCSFCKAGIEKGTGKMIVEKTGRALYFCTKRCEKNMLVLRRDPRHIKWAAGEKKGK